MKNVAPETNTVATVLITQRKYARLLRESAELAALQAAGVDNWEGYEEAMVNIPDDEE